MSLLSDFIGTSSSAMSGLLTAVNPWLGAGASIISGLAGKVSARDELEDERAWNAHQAELNRDFQREERLDAQEWNEKMWEREKEYNSPVNQLRLAMEAGINPNSVFGNSNPFVKTSAPTTSPQSGNVASSAGSLASSLLLHDAQLANLVANTRKTDADARGQEIANDYAPSINDQMLKKGEAEIDEIAKRADYTDEQTKQLRGLWETTLGKNQKELDILEQTYLKAIEEVNISKNDTKLSDDEVSRSNWKRRLRNKLGFDVDADTQHAMLQFLGSVVAGDISAVDASRAIKQIFSLASDLIKAASDYENGVRRISTPNGDLRGVGTRF